VPKPRTPEPSHRVRNLRADWYSFIYEEDVRPALQELEVWYEERHVSHHSFHLMNKLWKHFGYVRPV
jgi:ferric-dicitrate binding protein FerR (iron transport regulator)